MNKSVIRSLVAGAVMLGCQQAVAATAAITVTTASIEKNAADALGNAAAAVGLPNIVITPGGAAYLDNDIVTVTLTGGVLRELGRNSERHYGRLH